MSGSLLQWKAIHEVLSHLLEHFRRIKLVLDRLLLRIPADCGEDGVPDKIRIPSVPTYLKPRLGGSGAAGWVPTANLEDNRIVWIVWERKAVAKDQLRVGLRAVVIEELLSFRGACSQD